MSHAGTGKGKKRSRAFHRGARSPTLAGDVAALQRIEEAERAEAARRAEVAAQGKAIRDDAEVWQAVVVHSAPHVPSWL